MKLFKNKITILYMLFALAGGSFISSCEETDYEIQPIKDQQSTEDDNGQNNPPPPPQPLTD